MDDPSSAYPRTYQLGRRDRIAIVVLVVGSLAAFGFLLVLAYAEHPDRVFMYATSIGWVLLAALGAISVRHVFTWRLILSEDAIETHDVFPIGVRRMRREEIAGWRVVDGFERGRALVLVSKQAEAATMRISLGFKRDVAFRDWIIAFPDLDAESADASLLTVNSLSQVESDRVTRQSGAALRARRSLDD